MPLTPIPIGTDPWGALLNGQIADLDTRAIALSRMQGPSAFDQNLIAWTVDPATSMQNSLLVSGQVATQKIWIRQDTTITNILLGVFTAGSGLTAGQNLVGLYDSAGTRIGISADQSASWTSVGLKTIPLTVPQPVTAGFYYTAIMSNGTTPIEICRGSSLGFPELVNAGTTIATARYAVGPNGQTTLPASITLGTRTLSGRGIFTAVS